jgi:hypothetical protein
MFPATTRTFTKGTALSEQGRGAAWHVWINVRYGRGTAWARHAMCESALRLRARTHTHTHTHTHRRCSTYCFSMPNYFARAHLYITLHVHYLVQPHKYEVKNTDCEASYYPVPFFVFNFCWPVCYKYISQYAVLSHLHFVSSLSIMFNAVNILL